MPDPDPVYRHPVGGRNVWKMGSTSVEKRCKFEVGGSQLCRAFAFKLTRFGLGWVGRVPEGAVQCWQTARSPGYAVDKYCTSVHERRSFFCGDRPFVTDEQGRACTVRPEVP